MQSASRARTAPGQHRRDLLETNTLLVERLSYEVLDATRSLKRTRIAASSAARVFATGRLLRRCCERLLLRAVETLLAGLGLVQ
ncbi:unnamed protein product [Heligmosomoides polygyrus]|uniref:BBS2_C domain-containing protein n=1 Tax=Heligmosomoides polygyrus TaxID=6339 RepID=A0A183GV57_HELPZ|nr:unnamed protein product [Heligmosomoides polygyrus]